MTKAPPPFLFPTARRHDGHLQPQCHQPSPSGPAGGDKDGVTTSPRGVRQPQVVRGVAAGEEELGEEELAASCFLPPSGTAGDTTAP